MSGPFAGEAPSLSGATGWLNSQPLTPADLRGRVVLYQFCTYTCINWIRTLPHIRAWAARYGDHGLVVIGVHTPEFEFEQDTDNVRPALASMRVGYPIAIDSEYAIWRAFHNQYWPALYLADASGTVQHHRFGEGEYEQTELAIRRLLTEAGAGDLGHGLASVDAGGVEAAADWNTLGSPENYLGYERTESFASPGGVVPNRPRVYELPPQLGLNEWALSGDWTFEEQGIALNEGNGRIVYRFQARDLHLVAGSTTQGVSVPFRVLIDGQPPGAAHGVDVDEHGSGSVSEQRLYQLVRQRGPITERTFEITFLAAGAAAYVFTFG
jgi:thiol-disulfide isomerase/thioredoxin